MTRPRDPAVPILALSFLSSSFEPAAAHAFGARYDLPLPLEFYLVGAGAAVVLTFALLAKFASGARTSDRTYTVDLTDTVAGRFVLCEPLRFFGNAVGVFIFALIVAAGLFGTQIVTKNFAPTMVWVIWWVGFAFFVAFIGNIWPALNPWSTLFRSGARLLPPWQVRPYPERFGVWPSVVLFLGFAWLEIVSDFADKPRSLVILVAAYSVLTWIGMAMFGRSLWIASGEAFNQAFGILGRFAPFAIENENAGRRLVARPLGAGLIQITPLHPSMAAFVIVMLSTVTFDGFVETPAWAGILDWFAQNQTLRPLLLWFQSQGFDLLTVIKTVALLAFPCLFAVVYAAFCGLSVKLAGEGVAFADFANTLVLSLVPIAIAYHVAHYLSYLLLAGQLMIPLMSDPFGWGWDLFGTAHHEMDITIINAKTVWYTAVAAIVLGHVTAVWIAHVQALGLYESVRPALWSQVPMLVLMVLYTMLSLWILSQPIVEV